MLCLVLPAEFVSICFVFRQIVSSEPGPWVIESAHPLKSISLLSRFHLLQLDYYIHTGYDKSSWCDQSQPNFQN